MKKILLGFIAIGLVISCSNSEVKKETEQIPEAKIIKSPELIDLEKTASRLRAEEGVTDIDGNTYKSVIIGEQEWMTENLRTSKYSDGTSIPNITDNTAWFNNLSTGAWCYYENDSDYESTYGKMYNWYAEETSKLCPTGWHVPTDAEWTVLTDYLAANGHSGSEGKALKATSGWNSGGNGTDDFGWNGLPGGLRNSNGDFYDVGLLGAWWSSSQSSASLAWYRYLSSLNGFVYRSYNGKRFGFSVRCLRD